MDSPSERSAPSVTGFIKNPSTQITSKLLLIGALILGLLIPKYLVVDLVEERQLYSQQVNREVTKNWAGSQHLAGPFLVIPYWQNISETVDNKLVSRTVKSTVIVNPNDLTVRGDISTDKKYRSLYEVILYSSTLHVQGDFKIPDLAEMEIKPESLLLNEAYVSFIIGDAKGVKSAKDIRINGKSFAFKPSSKGISVSNNGIVAKNMQGYASAAIDMASDESAPRVNSGMHALLPLQNVQDALAFEFDMDLKGSNYLTVAPVAKNTKVNFKSPFADPVFDGNYTTDSTTRVSAKGFDAHWTVSEFQRNIPSFEKNSNNIDLQSSAFGVNITTQVDNYTKTERAAKYMVIIIVFTFLVVFITELINRLRIHIFQYTLIGLAIVIFYALLLSMGEYLSFDVSYLIACIAVIGLIALYAKAVFNNQKSMFTLLGALCGLFLFTYMIIQMEKYSLITGSIGVFVALAITMYATRKIQFYEAQ